MCGLVGFCDKKMGTSTSDKVKETLSVMNDSISHRGPNDSGTWYDNIVGIALAHRRLSIIDCSSAGHQPMHSASDRFVLVFNGEIYNHNNLRIELEKMSKNPPWRGHSDTETLLACFDAWGIESTLKRSIGMFALAIWDKHKQRLILARDRFGEKPLYYGWQNNTFMFASELKALKIHPAFSGEVDRDALCLLLRHNCIPSPYSIYQGIFKLKPGCLLTLSPHQREPIIKPYWSSADTARHSSSIPYTGSVEDAVDDLEVLLKNAIAQQMQADVPLGAFLSGGIDSSTIVALMQAQSDKPIKTFSIGSYNDTYNEAVHAKSVAKHLGTDHTELYVTPEEAMAVIPKLPTLYDEPFSDSSQIPTFLVSQLAKQYVTVSLTGDSGDELFLGYNRYALTDKLWSKLSVLPLSIRHVMASSLVTLSPQKWNKLALLLKGKFPYSGQLASLGDKLHKAATVLPCSSVEDLYKGLSSHWHKPADIVIGGTEPSTLLTGDIPNMYGLNQVERMAVLDTLTFMADDILCKVDRAAMGVSLETRVPFLDHRIAEFAWSLPTKYKLRNGQTKWPLRQVLYKYVPKELIERPKMGFGVPIDSWLRGPLREWAEALLDESCLRQEGYFNPAPIRKKWQEHLSGKRNWQHHLWDVLMFNAWLENN